MHYRLPYSPDKNRSSQTSRRDREEIQALRPPPTRSAAVLARHAVGSGADVQVREGPKVSG